MAAWRHAVPRPSRAPTVLFPHFVLSGTFGQGQFLICRFFKRMMNWTVIPLLKSSLIVPIMI
jgi:hypothetical protein